MRAPWAFLILPLLFNTASAFALNYVGDTSTSRVCVGNFAGSDLQWSIFQGDDGNPSFAADVPNHPGNATNHGYMCVQASYLGGPYTFRLKSADPGFSCEFQNLAGGEFVEVTPSTTGKAASCALYGANGTLASRIDASTYVDIVIPSPFGDQADQITGQAFEINSGGARGEDGADMRDGTNGPDGPNLAQGATGDCAGGSGSAGEAGGAAGSGQNGGSMYVKVDVVPGSVSSSGLTLALSGWREDPATLEKSAFPPTQVSLASGQYVLLRSQGGDGGSGGRGGNGGSGGNAGTMYRDTGELKYCGPGTGGNGGNGGLPGEAGQGGNIYLDLPQNATSLVDWFYIVTAGGLGGVPGLPGKGGSGGRVGTALPSPGMAGQDGNWTTLPHGASGRLDTRTH